MTKSAIMTAVAVAVIAMPARLDASDHGRKLPTHFEAALVGFQEVPSISTTGTGHVDLHIDDER